MIGHAFLVNRLYNIVRAYSEWQWFFPFFGGGGWRRSGRGLNWSSTWQAFHGGPNLLKWRSTRFYNSGHNWLVLICVKYLSWINDCRSLPVPIIMLQQSWCQAILGPPHLKKLTLLEYENGYCPTLIKSKGLSVFIRLWVTPPIANWFWVGASFELVCMTFC